MRIMRTHKFIWIKKINSFIQGSRWKIWAYLPSVLHHFQLPLCTLPFAQLSSSLPSMNNKTFFMHKLKFWGFSFIIILCVTSCNFNPLIQYQKMNLSIIATHGRTNGHWGHHTGCFTEPPPSLPKQRPLAGPGQCQQDPVSSRIL